MLTATWNPLGRRHLKILTFTLRGRRAFADIDLGLYGTWRHGHCICVADVILGNIHPAIKSMFSNINLLHIVFLFDDFINIFCLYNFNITHNFISYNLYIYLSHMQFRPHIVIRHLLRTIIANSDAECILRAKMLELYLTELNWRANSSKSQNGTSPTLVGC
jgi:hypothetical protein